MSHPDPALLAQYLDGTLRAPARESLEGHLAECRECREELGAVRAILAATAPRWRRWRTLVPLAAAAALALVWLAPRLPGRDQPLTRDPAFTTTEAPMPLQPVGSVAEAGTLLWASVPGAERYRVSLFGADGALLWQSLPGDTVAALPDSVPLVAGSPYFWQVKAETAYGRWVESELVEFRVTGRP